MAVKREKMDRFLITALNNGLDYFSDRQKVFDYKLFYIHGLHSVVSLNVLMQNYLIGYTSWVKAYQQ